MKVTLLVLIFSYILSACNLGVLAPQEPASIETPPTLTLEQILNTAYTLQGPDGSMQDFPLVDGSYEKSNGPSVSDVTHAGILHDKIAFGDINGDGAGDAVVPIYLNFGGTGRFVHIAAVLNQGGQPVHAAPATYGIGDRAVIRALTIEDGKILLSAIISGPADPMCCPSLPAAMTFEYSEMGFRLLHMTTTTPSGIMREISISASEQEASVGNQLIISGSTTVGPFENNLVYRIYDANGMAITEAGFTVQNDGLGAPSTFELPLDLGALGLSGRIRISISEMSMEDGS